MTISRMQQPRQMYGLGSFVKKAVKGVKGILKSDLGKAALLIGGGMYAGGLGPFAAAGRFGTLPGAGFASGLPGLITGGLDKLGLNVAKGGKPTFGQFSKVFGIGALGGAALEALTAAGLDTDNPNSMPRDVDSLKSYLKQGYLQLNPDKTAKDAEAFAEANTTEYKADGGRIGFANGMPKEGIETLLPKQKPSPMMQGVDKTIQSIDNFAQLIAQSGDPSSFRGHVDLLSEFIQKNDIDPSAAFDYVKRRVDEIKPGLSKFIFTTTEDMPVEKKAYGGRIGYEIGGPAYDATDASIYGSSAITVTPDTIMGPGGNQIQDKMGKPGIVSPITGMPLPYSDPQYSLNYIPPSIIDLLGYNNRPNPGIIDNNRPPGGYEAVGKPYIPPPRNPGNPGKVAVPDMAYRPGAEPEQLTGDALVNQIQGRMMQQDIKPAYWNAYAQDVIKTGGNPTKSLQEYQKEIGGGILELDLPAVGGNNNVGGFLPVMPPKSEYYTGKDYGPGMRPYTAVMPQPGMRYVYDEKGTRHSVPIEGYEGPTSGMPLEQKLSLSSYSDNIKSGLSPVASAMYATGGRAGYSGGTKGPDDLYTRSYKRVMELMDEGYDFGSAVKKYMEEEKERENKSYGGRIGYDGGTDFQKWLEGKQKFDQGQNAEQLYREYLEELRRKKVMEQKTMAANGGRIGYAFGNPEQNAMEAAGIEGLPLNQNSAGVKELDLRDSGGFIPPVGVKEKADDIPAMLSNNEFVFTADAVRGMGDGDVNKGAQRMYDMMKKLEGGGRV